MGVPNSEEWFWRNHHPLTSAQLFSDKISLQTYVSSVRIALAPPYLDAGNNQRDVHALQLLMKLCEALKSGKQIAQVCVRVDGTTMGKGRCCRCQICYGCVCESHVLTIKFLVVCRCGC